jgi:GAF domain-containing protein
MRPSSANAIHVPGVGLVHRLERVLVSTGLGGDGNAHGWPAIIRWGDTLATTISTRHAHQYIAVIVDDGTGGLRLAGQSSGAGVDLSLFVPGETSIPLDAVCGRVFRSGVPALIADVSMDPDYLPFLGTLMRSELAIPIRHADVVVGVVNLESPLVSAFDIADLDEILARIEEAVASYPAGWQRLAETA